jgi:hypothetical protein
MSVASLALSHKAEDPADSPRLRHPSGPGLQFDPAEAWLLDPDGEKRERQVGSEQVKWVKWKVEVRPDPDGDLITRKVWRNRERWNQRGGRRGSCAFDAFTEDASGGHRRHDEVIWPTWPGSARDEATASPSPLAARRCAGLLENRRKPPARLREMDGGSTRGWPGDGHWPDPWRG